MLDNETALQDLITAIREDAEARNHELARLSEQLEEHNRLLQQQPVQRSKGSAWLSIITIAIILAIGASIYMLVMQQGENQSSIARKLKSYMQHIAADAPAENNVNYMASMTKDIHRISEDMAAVLVEIKQVSTDIGVMRTATTDMRGDIGNMNMSMNSMRSDMQHMRNNIGGMSRSLSQMSRNVDQLTNGAQNLREPFRGMMPW